MKAGRDLLEMFADLNFQVRRIKATIVETVGDDAGRRERRPPSATVQAVGIAALDPVYGLCTMDDDHERAVAPDSVRPGPRPGEPGRNPGQRAGSSQGHGRLPGRRENAAGIEPERDTSHQGLRRGTRMAPGREPGPLHGRRPQELPGPSNRTRCENCWT